MLQKGSLLFRRSEFPCRQTGIKHVIINMLDNEACDILSETNYVFKNFKLSKLNKLFLVMDQKLEVEDEMTIHEIFTSLTTFEFNENLIIQKVEKGFKVSLKALDSIYSKKNKTEGGDERDSGVELLEEIENYYPEYLGNEEYLKLRKNLILDIQKRELSHSSEFVGKHKYSAMLYNDNYLTCKFLKNLKSEEIDPDNINEDFKNILNWVFNDNSWQINLLLKRAYYN